MIIPPNATEDELRQLLGADAAGVIAFRRFLALPTNAVGKKVCPPHWYAYGLGKLSAEDVLAIDDAEARA